MNSGPSSPPRLSRAAALGAIGGGIALGAVPAAAQNLPVVRMAGQIIEPAAEPYYGDAMGIFAANGIAPNVTTFGNGAAMIQAVAGGDLDVGETNPLQLAVAMTRDIPVQAIAVACIYSKAVANPNVVVAKNSPIRTPRDFTGTTFGIGALGDFSQISLFGWLEANGVSHTSVKFVELPVTEIAAALARNQIQAGFLVEPYKSEAVKAGLVRDFADTFLAVAPEVATVMWFASTTWLRRNPDAAKRLVKAIYATGAWANTHGPQAAEILSHVTKVELPALLRVPRRLFATHFDPNYVANTLALAARFGALSKPLNVQDFVASL